MKGINFFTFTYGFSIKVFSSNFPNLEVVLQNRVTQSKGYIVTRQNGYNVTRLEGLHSIAIHLSIGLL